MTEIIQMPRDGIVQEGALTKAGQNWLARLGDRIGRLASTATDFLAAGNTITTAGGIWASMVPDVSEGGGTWTPDLSVSLKFKRTISAPLTINCPTNIPNDAEPVIEIHIVQNSTGGWPVDYGAGFEGAVPVIFTNPGDKTILGLSLTGRNPDTFTTWACKGISAA